jgi:CRISPR/Cas system CSM-associated protein Csm3 (group 7 of RAMP superfamily)
VIRFKLRLRAVTLFTVGGGIPDVMGADIVYSKKARVSSSELKYTYYIPGSSIKGVLRTAASKIAPAYGFSACGKIRPEHIESSHKGGPCDVCKLFGYPGKDFSAASSLFVSDFDLINEAKSMIVTRVALDDKTLTAMEGALYSVEHLLPGAEFEGELRIAEHSKNLLPLLLLAIAELRTGRLGRSSVCDAKIIDDGALDTNVEPRWLPLLQELRNWLWEGIMK